MDRAATLFSPDGIRCITVAVAIGLLWATGIRVSELVNLTIKDVNFEKHYLHIRNTKFGKDRLVPLHATALEHLRNYDAVLVSMLAERTEDRPFFMTTGGKAFDLRAFEYAFTQLRLCLLPEGRTGWDRRPPRLYDIRHTFACRTVLRWLENGEDVNQKLHLLSVYMGHVKPADTYWYLTATPELLSCVCARFEAHCGKELPRRE